MTERAYSRRCDPPGTGLWRYGAALVLVVLSACASDERPGPRREGGPRFEGGPPDGPRPRPSLFVSPAGEPFRAGPGEPYPVAAWFLRADANGDGKLTRDEFVADAERFFKRVDANHDGVIDGFELKAYETEIVPEITAERGGPGGGQGGVQTFQLPQQGGQGGGGRRGGGRRGGGQGGGFGGGPGQGGLGGGGPGGGQSMPQAEGAAPYGLLGEREPVAGADLDLNSRITLANFKTKAAQRFARLDPDNRGYLLLAELPKTQVQQRAERGRRGGEGRPPE